MTHCINYKLPEVQQLAKDLNIHPALVAARIGIWQEKNNNLDRFPTVNELMTPSEVNFVLKSVDILSSDKAKEIFAKGEKNNWTLDKILTELQIPKEQKQLILGLQDPTKTRLIPKGYYEKDLREQIIIDLLANYSYTVEINTATESMSDSKLQELNIKKEFQKDNFKYFSDNEGYWKFDNTIDAKDRKLEKVDLSDYVKAYRESIEKSPTQHYSNLTVPGGTNYTENEISTPLITPSIKGHAQFSTDKGIGWFRSDDKIADKLKTTLGKELKYKDPYIPQSRLKSFKRYEVLNESGDNIGTVVVEYRGNKTVILHPKLNITGKGYGKDLYKLISSKFNVEVQEWSEGAIANSDSAKKMWDSLEKEGSAKRIIDIEQGDNFRVLNYNIDTSKTRRILEVQSDLFQKGRDKDNLVNINKRRLQLEKEGYSVNDAYDIAEKEFKENSKENKFLQLLNKNNNWVTFFIKSIIQDSAKQTITEVQESDVEAKVKELEKEGLLEIDCKGKIKAEKGLQTNFTKGGKWKLIKDLKGYPTHKEGGVDLTIGKNGVSIKNGNTEFTAKYGLVIPKN